MKNIVLLVYDITVIGGVENIAKQLANSFSKYYKVHLVSLCCKNHEYKNDSLSNISITYIANDDLQLRYLITKYRKKLLDVINNINPSCVLFMGTNAAIVGSVSILKKYKTIYCDHGAIINQLDNKFVTFLRFLAYKLSSITVTLTEKSRNDYIKFFKANNKKILQIYNAIDLKEINRFVDYNKNSNKIISVGRLSKEKGFDLLIEIATFLKNMNNDWSWDIWGDGPLKDEIYSKIVKNQLENHVYLKGSTDNLNNLYNDYCMLVLPSYREGLPLVLLEAKANKLPIVSFDINTGPSEIIKDNINGFLIEPYDTYNMALKINQLLSSCTKRIEFSNNSYMDIDKFKLENIISQWLEIIG